jgi:hypothetical protein
MKWVLLGAILELLTAHWFWPTLLIVSKLKLIKRTQTQLSMNVFSSTTHQFFQIFYAYVQKDSVDLCHLYLSTYIFYIHKQIYILYIILNQLLQVLRFFLQRKSI